MNRRPAACFSVLFLLGLFGCARGGDTGADCDPHAGSCTAVAGPYEVTLDITPKPVVHMQELTFDVSFGVETPESEALVLDLSMPGMDMGRNRVRLEKGDDGHYRGKGIIVRCASGRTLWRATVFLGDTLKPDFTFNVRD
ncbi:FixH family protein [Prosthecochloris sp. GSB1]|uniref:FixH family protein n=1 Tax=Prosthecochloris sp. GSB1 TaxID=281093 RepID=UPI001F33D3F2|nr:FixH family protein [Prosthecochloris sp. GSB1]